MKITIDKEYVAGNYEIKFLYDEKDMSEEFTLALEKVGEPTVDFGGTFTEEDDSTMFKLSPNIRKIKSQLPYSRTFKTSQYGENTKKYAEAYALQLKSRIEEVLVELRDNVNADDFSSNDFTVTF